MQEEEEIRQSWEEIKATSGGLCCICNDCGGSSISFCECAYQRYKNDLLSGNLQIEEETYQQDEQKYPSEPSKTPLPKLSFKERIKKLFSKFVD